MSQTIFIAVMLTLGIACLFIKIPIRNKASNPMGKDTVDRHSIKPVAIPFLAIAAISLVLNCVYTQDVGESIILINFGGSLAGHTSDAGLKVKMPWQEANSWDIRNRQINFYRDSPYEYDNGSYSGAEISINDASGTKANADIQLIYSIDGAKIEELYKEYGTQEAFVTNYVSNDFRSTAREVSGKFNTMTMLTDRNQYTEAIEKALKEKWKDNGVIVEQVSVQDIRYDDAITNAYAEAQSAEISKQKAINAQETAKVEAETKKIKAQGEADANNILTQSLSDKVLTQNYIDSLKEIGKDGNLVIVPEGSTPMINTSK